MQCFKYDIGKQNPHFPSKLYYRTVEYKSNFQT